MKKPSWKQIAIVAVFINIISISSVGYVLSQTASTFWIGEGIYPSAPTYTVWREGSNYFCKDANGRQPSWSGGTNASYVINNAVSYTSSAGGGEVYIKSGFYSLSARISAKDNIVLTGENPYSTILYAESDFGHIICHSAYIGGGGGQSPPFGNPNYNITIRNLGFKANLGNRIDRGILIRAYNLTVENCIFRDMKGYFIKAFYGGNAQFLYNKGFNSAADGFDFLNQTGGSIIGNEVHGTEDDCIAVVHSNDVIVGNNQIWGYYSGEGVAGDGIAVWGDSHGVVVHNNRIQDISHHGLSAKAYESADPSNITFTGNKVYHVGQNGLYTVPTYVSNASLNTLTITDNTFENCQWNGIRILVACYGIITGNQIIDAGLATTNTYSGIVIDYSSVMSKYSNSWIVNNNIIRNRQTPTLTVKYCIFLTGSYHVCMGNIAYGAGSNNIQDSSSGSEVDHNQVNGY